MQKQRSFEDEYTAPSGPISRISSTRPSVEIDDTDDDDSAYRGGGPVGAPAADFSFSAPSKPAPSPVRETLSFDEQEDEGFFLQRVV